MMKIVDAPSVNTPASCLCDKCGEELIIFSKNVIREGIPEKIRDARPFAIRGSGENTQLNPIGIPKIATRCPGCRKRDYMGINFIITGNKNE